MIARSMHVTIEGIQGHSPEGLPRSCRPASNLVLDPDLLTRIKLASLPHDFAVLLEEKHMGWTNEHSRDHGWLEIKTALRLAGFAVVEWQDNAAKLFYARCTRNQNQN